MQIHADGETLQLLGPRQARVRSSNGRDWYAVDLDGGDGFCTCKRLGSRRRSRPPPVGTRIASRPATIALQERWTEGPDPLTLARGIDLATSRFRNAELIAASGRTPVGIVVGRPRWKLKYEIAG